MQKKMSVDLGQRESRANILLLVATIKCTTFSLLFVPWIEIYPLFTFQASPSQIFALILTLLSHFANKRTPARFAATPLPLSSSCLSGKVETFGEASLVLENIAKKMCSRNLVSENFVSI